MKKGFISTDIISAILLLLFLYTALHKLSAYADFRLALGLSPQLRFFAGFLALSIPSAELIVCVLLFIPALRLAGLYASLFLLMVFTIYLSYMLLFADDRPCNCGGVISSMSWPQHIIFNTCFILLTVTGIILFRKNKKAIHPNPP